jgi:hypothetical protein
MVMRLPRVATIALILIYPQVAYCWEANYDQQVARPLQKLRDPSPELKPLEESRVEYPASEGSQLGEGWDMFLNKKVFSTCVDFKAQQDNSETVEENLHEATDEETRDVTLNMTFGIAGGATTAAYGDYKGNSSLTKNSFAHYYSKDVLLVSHASVTTGALFAVPTTSPAPYIVGQHVEQQKDPKAPNPAGPQNSTSLDYFSIHLLPGMADLKGKNPAEFRRRCGDGFVAAINYGADLYSLLTIHDTDTKRRQQLETAVQTSGGYAGFTASGSGSIFSLIDTENTQKNLTIQFVQRGGKIVALPVDLATLQDKIKSLPAEAWDAPKPIYMIVYPYSKLPEFQEQTQPAYLTALQAALRYYARLQTMHSEILDMEADYERDQNAVPTPSYFFSYLHRMRSEDVESQRETIEQEIGRISRVIDALTNCPQGCGSEMKDRLEKALGAKPLSVREQLVSAFEKQAQVQGLQPPGPGIEIRPEEFDDLSYWIRLPLPMTAISSDDYNTIKNQTNSIDLRRATFARNLYRHWVQRQDAARCSLYSECLSIAQKLNYYDEILDSISGQAGANVFTGKQLSNNQWQITIAPCLRTIVTNSRSAEDSNGFTISQLDSAGQLKTLLPRQRGEANANFPIPSIGNKTQIIQVQAWYGVGFQFPNQPMVSSTFRDAGLLSNALWFQDPGSTSDSPNLFIRLQAIPEPGPGCPTY